MNEGHPPEDLYELEVHPLNTMFAMIVSSNFFGLDINVIGSYKHFIQAISIAFLARILFTMIRTGEKHKYRFSSSFF
jgi:prepilin signal peptidase PulO-like enzyme (type II secretory pathway)